MLKKLSVLVLLISLAACKKQQSATTSSNYVPGDVIAGVESGVPIDSAFALFNKNGLTIYQVTGLIYGVPYATNQLDSISAYLNTKPYVDSANWKARIAYNYRWKRPVYLATFFDMNLAYQADWEATVKQLNFTQLHDSTVTMIYLKVPVGSETYWVNQLSQSKKIRWAELNYIRNIQL